jgi:putative membrane protein insertion efficiency factor
LRIALASCALACYKHALSPLLHAVVPAQGACRFQPTCSEYAAIAVAEHGIVRGGLMALGRVLRCHPLHQGGFDPVPAKRTRPRAGFSSPAISQFPHTEDR